jgi:hypothetical protein
MLKLQSKYIGLIGAIVLTLTAQAAVAQGPPQGGFPGGGGGFPGGGRGGGRGFDPGMFFDQIANGRPAISINEMPVSPRDPNGRERVQQWAAQQGISNGQLTRDQFVRYMEERRAQFRANGGPGGGGFRGVPAPAAPSAPNATPAPAPVDGGAVAPAPMSPDLPPAAPTPMEEEEKRPTVHRAGKLPKGLPDWFARLDTDGDGQIGLYEWKAAGRSLDEFRKIDRNGDGLITVEEALRAVKNGLAVAGGNQAGPARPSNDTPRNEGTPASPVPTYESTPVASQSDSPDRPQRRPGGGNRQGFGRQGGGRRGGPGGGTPPAGGQPGGSGNSEDN